MLSSWSFVNGGRKGTQGPGLSSDFRILFYESESCRPELAGATYEGAWWDCKMKRTGRLESTRLRLNWRAAQVLMKAGNRKEGWVELLGRGKRLIVGQESMEWFKSPQRMEEREGKKAIKVLDNLIAWFSVIILQL